MKKAYLSYFGALMLFGSNGVVASFIDLTSYQIVFLRSLLGSILLVAIFFFTGHQLTALHHKKDLLLIALSGLAMAGDWLLLFEAYAQIGVSLGMLLNYCGPAIVVALSPLMFGERVTGQKVVALMAALVGVFFVSGGAVVNGVNPWGVLLAILSAFSYAAMVILNKKATQVVGMENATLQLVFAFAAIAIFVGWRQGFHMEIATGDYLPILWLGFVNTGLSCWFYFSAIGALPAQTVAICGYLEPLSAVFLAGIFLHETMLPLQILGAVLILGGAVFGECAIPKRD